MPVAALQTSLPTKSGSTKSCPTLTVFTNVTDTARSDDDTQGDKQGENSDETKKVGLAVGFGIGIPLLAALSAVVFLLLREKRSHQALRQQLSGGMVQPVNPKSTYGWKKPYEMCAREEEVKEMPTGAETIPELHADRSGG